MAGTYTLPGIIGDMSLSQSVADSLLVNLRQVLPAIDELEVLIASHLVLLEDTFSDVRENQWGSTAP